MMTSSNGNIFRITGHLCREFSGLRRIPHTKASDAGGALIFSLICVWINGWVNIREAGDLRRYRAHYDVSVMARSMSRYDANFVSTTVCHYGNLGSCQWQQSWHYDNSYFWVSVSSMTVWFIKTDIVYLIFCDLIFHTLASMQNCNIECVIFQHTLVIWLSCSCCT